jgi:hypothetical protein
VVVRKLTVQARITSKKRPLRLSEEVGVFMRFILWVLGFFTPERWHETTADVLGINLILQIKIRYDNPQN